MTVHALDLNEYTTPDVKVFAGRDRGKAIRDDVGIRNGDHVDITVPDGTFALCTTFLFELLGGVASARVVNDAFHDGKVQEALADYLRVISFRGSYFPAATGTATEGL